MHAALMLSLLYPVLLNDSLHAKFLHQNKYLSPPSQNYIPLTGMTAFFQVRDLEFVFVEWGGGGMQ